tara:strand:- start:1646 stop:1852 length:207 start_codon:yes stop_codon:yes gene_type:complete
MRILVENYGNVRVFKDRSLFGLPRYVIEEIEPDFGFRYTKVFSGIWYKKERVLDIALDMARKIDGKEE